MAKGSKWKVRLDGRGFIFDNFDKASAFATEALAHFQPRAPFTDCEIVIMEIEETEETGEAEA